MIDYTSFKIWLYENQKYSERTISNIVSRLKRANQIKEVTNEKYYLFDLEENENFKVISSDIKSQIKKALKLYYDFLQFNDDDDVPKDGIKVMSLFANIGVAEAYFKSIGINVVLANELVARRATLYSKIYPNTKMICGDINDKNIKNKLIDGAKKYSIDVIMATPPCQGMSTAGQQKEDDIRNSLICPVVEIVKNVEPKYVFIENVPLFLSTEIIVNEKSILIPDYLQNELGDKYIISKHVINTKNYGVPQMRERAIILLSRKDMNEWIMPSGSDNLVTLRDTIGWLPKLDPFIKDVSVDELLSIFPHFFERKEEAQNISPWHIPPVHIKRQVIAMMHTPSGCTAFDNKKYFPIKEDGTPVKGYHNTYKRQNWDTPAYTVTMDNRKISSQNNVHPGRYEGVDENGDIIYSDARALTLFELMLITSLPNDWPVPKDTPEAFLRSIIGEGIPPLFTKKVFEQLKEVYHG